MRSERLFRCGQLPCRFFSDRMSQPERISTRLSLMFESDQTGAKFVGQAELLHRLGA
jgi:hypothetical protein